MGYFKLRPNPILKTFHIKLGSVQRRAIQRKNNNDPFPGEAITFYQENKGSGSTFAAMV